MDDLLKEAIADAKQVRETALANAKMALEEAFTPRLQSMLSKKIQAEVGEEEEEVPAEFSDEDEEEVEIAPEAPAEFSAEDDEVAPEAPAEFSDEDDEIAPEAPAEFSDEDEEELAIPAEEGVIEINGVKYAPVVSEEDELEDEVEEEYSEEDVEDGHEEVSDADLDLEAVLKELEDELNEEDDEVEEPVTEGEVDSISPDNDSDETLDSSDIGNAENAAPSAEASDSSDVGQGSEEPAAADAPEAGSENPEDEKGQPADEASLAESSDDPMAPPQEDAVTDVEEEIDLEEIIKALQEEEAEAATEQVSKLQSDLDEHRNVVKYLRSKLNEVNLLNAKLLFTNKLFRVFGLNQGQKVKVVETFDRAKNIREVKLVYSTMAESFGANSEAKPKIVKESKGSASKPVASTKSPKQKVISEGDSMRDRFQKLAKII